ncbi:hypothetical protein, partial [Lactobacillus sp.]|uniref:hypothetical protein n=1 Tax=Lactobacillus sp. TaxID=1591 RepID=UPI003EF68E7D
APEVCQPNLVESIWGHNFWKNRLVESSRGRKTGKSSLVESERGRKIGKWSLVESKWGSDAENLTQLLEVTSQNLLNRPPFLKKHHTNILK